LRATPQARSAFISEGARQGKARGWTRRSLWRESWPRSPTRGGMWCATTEPTRIGPGAAPKGGEPARGEQLGRGGGACPAAGGAGHPETPLGESDPTGVRDRPAGVSSLWRRDAGHCLHHRAEGHPPDRGPPAPAREGSEAAAAVGASGRTGCGHAGVRSAPLASRDDTAGEKGSCRPRGR
jgi:hypothetical protein